MSNRLVWLTGILVCVALQSAGVRAQGFSPWVPLGRRVSRMAWLDLGRLPMGWGLIRCATQAEPVRWEKHLGFEGMLPASKSPDPSLYLAVAPGFLWRSTGTFFLTIEYWDNGPGAFEVQYMGEVGSATPPTGEVRTKRFYTGGTRLWQSEHLMLPDARMEHELSHGADLRLLPPGTPVRRVFLSRWPSGEVDRVQPEGARRKVAAPPKSLHVFIRPSDPDELLREGETDRREQWLNLYASWGAEAAILHVSRDQLAQSESSENIPVASWRRMFQRQAARVLLEINPRGPEDTLVSMWDPEELQRWEQAAKTVSRYASPQWLAGVVVDLREVVGLKPGPALKLVWRTPAVLQDFRRAVRNELGTLSKINQAWGTRYRRRDDVAPFLKEDAPCPPAAEFVTRWLRRQQAYLLDRVFESWRSSLRRYPLYVRVPCQAGWGAVDPMQLCEIAGRYDVSILVTPEKPNPAVDPAWVLMGAAARRAGVGVGLDVPLEEPGAMSAALFALASEGGTALVLSEDDLARRRVFDLYRSGVNLMEGSPRPGRVAVLYPWTAIQTGACEEFDGRFAGLRDAVPVDLVDERDLIDPSRVTRYGILVHLAGDTWPGICLAGLEQWIRLGRLFLYAGDRPIVDEHGSLEAMTRLFPFQLNPRRPSPAALSPISRRLLTISVLSSLEDLRAGWLKEVGRGYTLYVPNADQNPEAYIRLVTTIVRDPSLISRRLGPGVKGDGLIDGVFTAQVGSSEIILNLSPAPYTPAGLSSPRAKRRSSSIPPWGLARSSR